MNLVYYMLPHQCKCFVSVCEILTAETCGKLSECIFKCRFITHIILSSLAGPDLGLGSQEEWRNKICVADSNIVGTRL